MRHDTSGVRSARDHKIRLRRFKQRRRHRFSYSSSLRPHAAGFLDTSLGHRDYLSRQRPPRQAPQISTHARCGKVIRQITTKSETQGDLDITWPERRRNNDTQGETHCDTGARRTGFKDQFGLVGAARWDESCCGTPGPQHSRNSPKPRSRENMLCLGIKVGLSAKKSTQRRLRATTLTDRSSWRRPTCIDISKSVS